MIQSIIISILLEYAHQIYNDKRAIKSLKSSIKMKFCDAKSTK